MSKSCDRCEDLDTCPLGDKCPVADEVEAMQPWGCPWCGEECTELSDVPDYMRAIAAYDMWLEAHITECEPYLKEQGGGE